MPNRLPLKGIVASKSHGPVSRVEPFGFPKRSDRIRFKWAVTGIGQSDVPCPYWKTKSTQGHPCVTHKLCPSGSVGSVESLLKSPVVPVCPQDPRQKTTRQSWIGTLLLTMFSCSIRRRAPVPEPGPLSGENTSLGPGPD